MRAVVTRVTSASVRVEDEIVGSIGLGLLVLVGVAREDVTADAAALARKVAGLRIFADETGAMNRDIRAVGGAALLVSQFTLLGDVRHGRRPSFIGAAAPALGRPLFEKVVSELDNLGLPLAIGRFGATMTVASVNDGPVTILLDTTRLF